LVSYRINKSGRTEYSKEILLLFDYNGYKPKYIGKQKVNCHACIGLVWKWNKSLQIHTNFLPKNYESELFIDWMKDLFYWLFYSFQKMQSSSFDNWKLIVGWGTDSSNTEVLDFTTIPYTIILSYSHLNNSWLTFGNGTFWCNHLVFFDN